MQRRTPLGKRQLETLRAAGTTCAFVIGTKRTRHLCELGLMQSHPDGHFAHVTPAGLRALADAAEAGRIKLFHIAPNKKPLTP